MSTKMKWVQGLWVYFLHLLSRMPELLHDRCAHTLFSIQKFNKQMHREGCTFLISINKTTFTCVPWHCPTFWMYRMPWLMWYTTCNLVVIFVEVFIFAPADKTYRYAHRHRQVWTVTQSLRRSLSVGLNQVSAFSPNMATEPFVEKLYSFLCTTAVLFSTYNATN